MANIVIKGVYATKSALDTAELAAAEAGDTYIVGSKIPYDLYTFKSGSFKKGDKVSNVMEDLTTPAEYPIAKMFCITFKDGDKTYKLRENVGRKSHGTFELFGV